jgi:hypothetical protein
VTIRARLDALEASEVQSAPPAVKAYRPRPDESAADFRARALAEHEAFPGAQAILIRRVFVSPGSRREAEEES